MSLTLKYFIFTTYRIIYTRFILHTVTNQQQSTIHLKKKPDYQSNREKFWYNEKKLYFCTEKQRQVSLGSDNIGSSPQGPDCQQNPWVYPKGSLGCRRRGREAAPLCFFSLVHNQSPNFKTYILPFILTNN